MTPQEALRFVDAMCARAPGTRDDHAMIQEALIVLAKLVDDSTVVTEETS